MFHDKIFTAIKPTATEGAGTVNGPTVDVKGAKGGIFMASVTAIGTSLAIKLQGSLDGTTWGDLPAGSAFASITTTGIFFLEWYGTHFLPRYIRASVTAVGAGNTYRIDAALDPIV